MRPLFCLALLVAALCLFETVDAKPHLRTQKNVTTKINAANRITTARPQTRPAIQKLKKSLRKAKERKRREEFEDVDDSVFDDEDRDALYDRVDQEEFLGMSKKERKKRIGIIFGKMDSDQDGFLTETELQKWINAVMAREQRQAIDLEWTRFKLDNDSSLAWDVYAKMNKADLDEKTDKQKWTMADLDKDGQLSKGEFGDFLYPEGKEHMKDSIALDSFNNLDSNSDGYLTQEEFFGGMVPKNKGKKEPEWVAKEMEKFTEVDTDNDGKVTLDQIREVLVPSDFDYALNEAKLLIRKADADKDGKLNLDEMVAKQKMFSGSDATANAEALLYHDEF